MGYNLLKDWKRWNRYERTMFVFQTIWLPTVSVATFIGILHSVGTVWQPIILVAMPCIGILGHRAVWKRLERAEKYLKY